MGAAATTGVELPNTEYNTCSQALQLRRYLGALMQPSATSRISTAVLQLLPPIVPHPLPSLTRVHDRRYKTPHRAPRHRQR